MSEINKTKVDKAEKMMYEDKTDERSELLRSMTDDELDELISRLENKYAKIELSRFKESGRKTDVKGTIVLVN